MKSIKDYRKKELISYIVANAVVLLLLLNLMDFKEMILSSENISQIINSVLVTSCVSVFSYLGDSILEGDTKDKLVDLWRKRPGEVVFTQIQINNKDIRFTKEQVIKKYNEIYSNMPTEEREKYVYENSKWYSIYHKFQKVEKIYNSNRDSLLCRDMHVSTYLIFIIYIFISLFNKSVSLTWPCVIFEIGMLIITNIAARQKAKRLVYNVIAYDIHQKESVQNYFYDNREEIKNA